jgi:probable selenium-dependent hydroxylase accessory protein YqeC
MVNAAWQQHRRVTIAGRVIGAGKLAGLHPNQPYELLTKSGADVVIVEADGARHSMIKAPAAHEPVVPPQTNVALLLMSAEAINQPLSTEVAHRPERVAAVLGIHQGDILTTAHIARLMINEQGAMKNIPEQIAVYLLITHVSLGKRDVVQQLVSLLQHSPRLSGIYCSAEPGEWFVI